MTSLGGSTGAPGPTELCGRGTGICASLGGCGADDFAGDVGVKAVALAGVKGFLHAAVFAGMERQNGSPAPWIQAGGEMTQE